MDWRERWIEIESIGEGGQGKVIRVVDSQEFDIKGHLFPKLKRALEPFSSSIMKEEPDHFKYNNFKIAMDEMRRYSDPQNHYALKVLHSPEKANNPETAQERIQREIDAMAKLTHPNLLALADVDPDHQWYVARYYPDGTLADHSSKYFGNLRAILREIIPLVKAVAHLHEQRLVHRDIKPENIFVDQSGELVLGDFGLVYYSDDKRTRLSGTLENVGSWDWMPLWAQSQRLEVLTPAFDVFSLGKLIWKLLSGEPRLHLWYYDRDAYNVELLCPDALGIEFANPIFSKSIVENEEDCLANAGEFLKVLQQTLIALENPGTRLAQDVARRCQVCHQGQYNLIYDRTRNPTNFGLVTKGENSFKIFRCRFCGHVQLFHFDRLENSPPAWDN